MSSDEGKLLSRELDEPYAQIISDYIAATYPLSREQRLELADACRRFFEMAVIDMGVVECQGT